MGMRGEAEGSAGVDPDERSSMTPRRRYARAPRTRRIPGRMNKGEAAYAAHLEIQLRAGHISFYRYEAMTLKLADDCRLTVDFLVINADDEIELHEVKPASKGKYFAREDSRIKLKVC